MLTTLLLSLVLLNGALIFTLRRVVAARRTAQTSLRDYQQLATAQHQELATLATQWRNLHLRVAAAFCNAPQFSPDGVQREQLATIGRELARATLGKAASETVAELRSCQGQGGFQEGTDEQQLRPLLLALSRQQLAELGSLMLNGLELEAAFHRLGICVLSPVGKAVAQGKILGYVLD